MDVEGATAGRLRAAIVERLDKLKIKPGKLAEMVQGVSRSTCYDYVAGKVDPSSESIEKILTAIGWDGKLKFGKPKDATSA